MENLGEEEMKIANQSNTSIQSNNDDEGFWTTVDEFSTQEIALNYFLMFVSLATVVSDSIALYVVNRGKNFPRVCRIFSMNYLVSDLVGAVAFIVHQILIYSCGYTYDIVLMSRVTIPGISLLISSASIASISIDRVMALVFNLTHKVPSNARISASVVTIWLFSSGLILGSAILKIHTDCQSGGHKCYLFDVFKVSRYLMFAMLLAYDIILLITNIRIQQFVKRHVTQIIKQRASVLQARPQTNKNSIIQEESETWKVVTKIILSYFILHIPTTVNLCIHEFYGHMRNDFSLRGLRISSFLCLQISSFVHLYLYVFKLKENKLNMYILLSRVFKKYKHRAEQLRIDVYNIPIASGCHTDTSMNKSVSS